MKENIASICRDKMTKLEPPKRWYEEMAISITEGGWLALNSRLQKDLEEDDVVQISIYASEDYKTLLICQEQVPVFTFGKTGRIKYPELAHLLEKKGYRIPARYVVEQSPNEKEWIARLQEVSEAPKLQQRRKRNGKKDVKL